ncbi:hypothetical protein [Dactylosporangium sp. CA-092794]|uniref:hypothetical protein n=1 Tax=Dactylosporangium sp. CA-092794 TaxID=3239929 RepID=UPI003D93C2FE
MIAFHGSSTAAEMHIPLLAIRPWRFLLEPTNPDFCEVRICWLFHNKRRFTGNCTLSPAPQREKSP